VQTINCYMLMSSVKWRCKN